MSTVLQQGQSGLGSQYGWTSEPVDLHTIRTKLIARAETLQSLLANVDAHRKELEIVERMLAAMKEPE